MCGERPRTPRPVRAARSCPRPSYGGGQVSCYPRLVIRALRRARLAPLAAAVALFATMPITVSSLLHDEMDDAISNPAVVVHYAAAHRIGAAADALPDSQHCVLCLRCSRCARSPPRCGLPAPRWTRLRLGRVDRCHQPRLSSSRPARAPRSPPNSNPRFGAVRRFVSSRVSCPRTPHPRTREPDDPLGSGGCLCGLLFYVWSLWP